MKKVVFCAVTAFFVWDGGTAAFAMTLEDVFSATYESSPELQTARASLRATDELVPQALSGWRPRISAEASYGQRERRLRGEGTWTTPETLALTLSQPLFRGFRTVAATDAAENAVKAARENLLLTEQSVLLSAAQAYMEVLRTVSVRDLRVKNEQVLQRQLEATRDRFSVGEITRTDVSQAEARHAGAIADRIAADASLRVARATFERVVGVPPENLEWPHKPEGLPSTLDDTVHLAQTQQPSLIAAEYAARAALDEVRGVRGELLPSVSLSASRKWDWGDHSSSDEQQVMATVSIPLYQSGRVYSRLRAAKITAGQRRLEVDEAYQDVRAQAITSWEAFESAQAQIESLTSQIRSSKIALDGVQREERVGTRTVLDVLNAERELLDARVNLVAARCEEQVASFQLMSAIGLLTARALKLPVDLYEPTEHYDDVCGRWARGDDQSASDYTMATEAAVEPVGASR